MGFTGITIVNGKKSDSKACIAVDQGVNFGRGVFETIAIAGDSPVFLDKHCERMNKGLSALGIDKSVREELIIGYIRDFSIEDCGMKVLVTPENIVVSTRENIYSTGQFKDGLKVGISSLKRNPHSHVVYHKTLNYTDNIIEKDKAHKAGFNEVIFTNVYDYLAEGSVSNLFFVSGNRIYTPATECGLLNGIIRSWVVNNFDVEKGEFTMRQLMDADEMFLTNSLMGIMPVRQIQDKIYNSTEKCCKLQKAYSEEIEREVEKYMNKEVM
ncbi:MAG: 4-amino-4-deoxychorismate lyase [Ruminiclostridium sp.]|nr:4-amino-4-deoxychorismate lyase [Ruminiclostridium sp.]